MNYSKLPIGTKLMWDAPLPFEGYVSPKSLDKYKIRYTIVICDRSNYEPGTKLKTLSTEFWAGDENQFIRMPTEEELKTLTFPTI